MNLTTNMSLLLCVPFVSACSEVLTDSPFDDSGATEAAETTATGSATDVSTSSPNDESSATTAMENTGTTSAESTGIETTEDATSTGIEECDPAELEPIVCFRALEPGTMLGTENPTAFLSGDLDDDGAIDLVTSDADVRSVSSFRGTGDGWFWPGNSYSVDPEGMAGALYQPVGGVLADLDGDGYEDLLVAVLQLLETDLLVFAGDGTSAFTLISPAPMPLPGHTFALEGEALDVDGDLDVDVATNAGADGIALLRNDGSGGLTFETITAAAVPTNVRAFDMIGDDATDVMISHASGLELFENQGGTLTSVAVVEGPDTAGLAVGDLDGDGVGDVVAIDAIASEIWVRLGTGSGFADALVFDSTFEAASVSPARAELELGDLDGDGDLDLVAGGEDDGIVVFTGEGDGTFVDPTRYDVGNGLYWVELADLDADTRPDIAALNPHGLLRVLLADPCACPH